MRFTDLRVWQMADALCGDIYAVTEGLPASEVYGLKVQLRRASVSIGSNIAEEIRNLLIVCSRRGFLKVDPRIDRRVDAVCGMLVNLRKAVLSKLP